MELGSLPPYARGRLVEHHPPPAAAVVGAATGAMVVHGGTNIGGLARASAGPAICARAARIEHVTSHVATAALWVDRIIHVVRNMLRV